MLRRLIFVCVGSIAASFACSTSNNQQPSPTEAGPQCPTSPKDTVGKPCSQEGYSCAVGYLCPVEVWQQAHCTCTKGVYACVDSTGSDVMAGADPACSPVPAPTETCGTTPMDIAGKPCMTAMYSCYYTGVTCPNENGGKPYTDDCVCQPKPAGPDASAGLVWTCEVHACN